MFQTGQIDRFIAWGRELAATSASGVRILVEACIPTENSAAKIDFENSGFLARITLWSDGSFYAEAINAETAETILGRHGCSLSTTSFGKEFSDILDLFEISEPNSHADR